MLKEQRGGREAVAVEDHGSRRVDEPQAAGPPEPRAEVGGLPRHERFIEQADLIEDLPAERQVREHREGHAGPAKIVLRGEQSDLRGVALGGGRGRVPHDLPCHSSHAGVRERLEQRAEPRPGHHAVAISERHDLAPARLDGGVARTGHASLRHVEQLHREPRDDLRGPVRRTVVHHENLPVGGEVNRHEGGQAFADRPLPVTHGNHHRDEPPGHHAFLDAQEPGTASPAGPR